ncbi:hypothetical protein DFH28DRAFT_907363 [Melampsora americana]|nr:hypothetical protein DFH28DRAFT_907363 [Melampsora americana]
MIESTYIEITHKKWIHNIQTAFLKSNIPQYDVLVAAYSKWCVDKETEERDVNLFDLNCDIINTEQQDQTSLKHNEVSKSKSEINTTMIDGEDIGHNMTSLSEYFHRLMVNKTVHVPVSIFCPKWLLYDASYMRSKRSRPANCSTDTLSYNGHIVTNEYRLSFAEWTVRYDLMVKYQATKYDVLDSQKHSPIAPRLIAHKENVLQLKIDCDGKWTPAMRYDVAHRRNVWENRLSNGAMADVGKLNRRLAEQAERDSKNYGDYNYLDNPFVLGGPMQHINPLDGLYNPTWDSLGTPTDNHLEMLTGRGVGVWGNHQVSAFQREQSTSTGVMKPRNTYRGRHFNPYHNKNYHVNNSRNAVNDNSFHYVNPGYHGYNQTYQRGGIGGPNRGRGRGGRPSIGQGSFDKGTMGAYKPVARNGDSQTTSGLE